MKILLPILLLLIPFILPAQDLHLSTGEVKHDKEMRTCVEVLLQPKPDEIKEAWEDYLDDEYDVDLKGYGFLANKDVLSAEEVDFKTISDKKMDFYTRIVEEKDMTKMCVYASLGYDIFINPRNFPKEFQAMENITKKFLAYYLPKYYEEQLNNTREKISEFKSDREDMKNEMEDNRKEIEKLSKRNEQLAKEISEKENTIDQTQNLLQTRQENWKAVKNKLEAFTIREN